MAHAHNFINLTGERFGRLTVLSYAGRTPDQRDALFNVRCDCGVKFIARSYALRSGATRSCGCIRRERAAAGMLAERERLASCPAIKGWVARDGHGCIAFSNEKPSRIELWKLWKVSRDTPVVVLPTNLFPALRWEDESIEVEIIFKTNQTTLK